MLFLLLNIGIAKYSIRGKEYSECGINIDGNVYDFRELNDLMGFVEIGDEKGNQFKFRLCGELEEDEFPSGLKFMSGVSSVMSDNNGEGKVMGLFSTQDMEYYNPDMGSNGISLHYYFSPNSNQLHQTVFNLKCNNSEQSSLVERVEYETVGDVSTVVIDISGKYGCGVSGNVPLPTYYNKSCKFLVSFQSNSGIKLDMRKYNEFRFGKHLPIDANHYALIQTCDSMGCPPGKICDAHNSSVWLCDDTDKCVSYAAINDEPIFVTLIDGVHVEYPEVNNHLTHIDIACDNSLIPDYLRIEYGQISNNILKINAKSKDACERNDLKPINDIYRVGRVGRFFDIDINVLHYTSNIRNKIPPKILDFNYSVLFFHPFSAVPCPDGYSCNTGAPTSVWLCTPQTPGYCKSYGLYDEKIHFEFVEAALFDGIMIYYDGLDSTQTSYLISCSRNQPYNSTNIFVGDSRLSNNDRYLSIVGSSPNVCNIGWDLPSPSVSPTPTPIPRLTSYVYQTNGTHSILLDTSILSIMEDNISLFSNLGGLSNIEVYYSPFVLISCPIPGSCDYVDSANGFGCWDRNKSRRCTPFAFSNAGVKSYPHHNDISSGIVIDNVAQSPFLFRLSLICGEESPITMVTFYEPNMFNAWLMHPSACPSHFVLPTLPPKPDPTPIPTYDVQKVRLLGVDMSTSARIMSLVMLAGSKSPQRSWIIYSPGPLISCPTGAFCVTNDNTTAWKCWESEDDPFTCHSIADARTGFVNSEDTVYYTGGYAGYSLSITAQCHQQMGAKPYTFSPTGYEEDNSIELILYSKNFCPNPTTPVEPAKKESKTPPLPYFIFGILFCYFGLGSMYIKCSTGSCRIPHYGHWTRAWNYVCCEKEKLDENDYLSLDS